MTSFSGKRFSGSFNNRHSANFNNPPTTDSTSLPGLGFAKLDFVNSSLKFVRPEKEEKKSSLSNYVQKLTFWHKHSRKSSPTTLPDAGRLRNTAATATAATAATATAAETAGPSGRSPTQQTAQPTQNNGENQGGDNNENNAGSQDHMTKAGVKRGYQQERSSALDDEEEEQYGQVHQELSFPQSRSPERSRPMSVHVSAGLELRPKLSSSMPTPSIIYHMDATPEAIPTTAAAVPTRRDAMPMPSLSTSSSSSSTSDPASSSYQSSVSTVPPAQPGSPISSASPQQLQPITPFFRQKSKSLSTQGAPPTHRKTWYGGWNPSAVTASSYDSLVSSPAVSFLSQFAAPASPLQLYEEEGDQVGRYVLGKVVGRGGFSTVREAYECDPATGVLGRKVACKVVPRHPTYGGDMADSIKARLDKEVAIWRLLKHPSIAEFLEVEETSHATFVFSEFCPGGDLLHHMTSTSSGKPALTEDRAREIFLQISEAILYLHNDVHVSHKDLKLENILLDADGKVKLADFGLAEWQDPDVEALYMPPRSPQMNSDDSSSPMTPTTGKAGGSGSGSTAVPLDVQEDIAGGSLAYASPEQLRTSKVIRYPATDIWALGVVLYALVTGGLPFMDEYEPRMQYKILNVRYDEPQSVSQECKDLLHGCLKAKPAERLDIQGVLDSDWCSM